MTDKGRRIAHYAVLTWLAGAMTGLAVCLAALFGGRVEGAFNPVLDNIRLDHASITRDSDRLCFAITADKHRLDPLEDIDSFLDRPETGDRQFPDITDASTGRSWHRNGAKKVKDGDLHSACVELPPDAKPDEAFVLNITVLYRGWRGLWYVPVEIPTIHSPGITVKPTPPRPSRTLHKCATVLHSCKAYDRSETRKG